MSGVLLVDNFLPTGRGSHVVSTDLAQGLQTLGWRVVTTSEKTAKLARLADMCRAVWRYRDRYNVANIAVYSGWAFLWAEAVAGALRAVSRPFVLTLHGGALPEFAQRWPRRVERLLQQASAVSTPSGFLADAMRTYRPDITLIPNPIDVCRYPAYVRTAATPRLVWLRALHPLYQPMMALRVLANLRVSYPDARLTMIGPEKQPGLREQLQLAARKWSIGDAVKFTGAIPKEKVPDHLAEHDIFLNTTTVDNTPISVIEALACGLCVVSTDAGGLPYLLKHGEDALLVPVGSTAEMTEAVLRILEEPALAAQLSRNARIKAEGFDAMSVLTAWDRLLRTVAERRAT